jgi:hypothetical protein
MRWQEGVGACCLALCLTAVGQAAEDTCKEMTYENRNQIDYGPLKVAGIRGTVQDWTGVPIPKACVGVFTEADQKLIAVARTDDSGNFELKGIPDGEYRLVGKYDGFCPANAKLQITRRGNSKKRLTINMRGRSFDTCSWVELK